MKTYQRSIKSGSEPQRSTISGASDADRHTIVVLCMLAMVSLVVGSLIYPSLRSAPPSLRFASPSLPSASRGSFSRPFNSVDDVRAPAPSRAPASAARDNPGLADESSPDSSHSIEPLGLVAAVFFLILAMLDRINEKLTRPIDYSSRVSGFPSGRGRPEKDAGCLLLNGGVGVPARPIDARAGTPAPPSNSNLLEAPLFD